MATSGTVGPSFYANNSFPLADFSGGNVPNNRSMAPGFGTATLVMGAPSPDPGYGVKTLVFHSDGFTNGSNDGYNDPNTFIRWYAYTGSTQLGFMGAVGAASSGSGSFTYNFPLPQQTVPDIRIYCEANGFSQFGFFGDYTTTNPGVWSNASVDWTAVPMGRTIRMVI